MQFKQTPEPAHTAIVEVRRKFRDIPGDPQFPTLVPPLLVYGDLFLYMRHYITCGNLARLASDHGDLLEETVQADRE